MIGCVFVWMKSTYTPSGHVTFLCSYASESWLTQTLYCMISNFGRAVRFAVFEAFKYFVELFYFWFKSPTIGLRRLRMQGLSTHGT